jgi:hypothetical protein
MQSAVPALLDGDSSTLDESDDLAGVDAFFAQQAGGGRSRG